MSLVVVTAPEYKPVSLAEARAWCRIDEDDTAQDALLSMLIGAMTGYAENLTGRAFVQRTLRASYPGWCASRLELAAPPLIGVDSVKYLDADDVEQTLAVDQYEVHDDREPALILPSYGATAWPVHRSVRNAVRVTFRAGYAPVGSPTDEAAHQAGQPDALKTWLHARIATLWDNRDQLVQSNRAEIPRAFADGLLDELVIGARIGG